MRAYGMFAALCIGSAASVGTAQAQNLATAPAATPSGTIEEVIVTARRREERLQDVPIAVTAIPGDALTKQSINQLFDLKTKAPGLAVQPSAYGSAVPYVGMRGQLNKQYFGSVNQSVGVYFDEIALSRLPGLNSSLYDLASAQLLKGPQGTLFGRNTPGGAVLFTSKLPGPEREGYVRGVLGNYDQRTIEGAVTLPVNDSLSIRLAGRRSTHDGYIKNAFTGNASSDEDSWAARFSAVYAPSDRLKNTTVLDWVNEAPRGSSQRLFFVYPNAAGARFQQYLDILKNYDFHTIYAKDSQNKIRLWTLSNITTYELGEGLTFKNIAGFRETHSYAYSAIDGAPVFVTQGQFIERMRQYSLEPQLIGTLDEGNLSWIVGAYLYRETGYSAITNFSANAINNPNSWVTNKSQAIYSQATWKLPFYRALSVTAGGRYTRDQRDILWRVFLNGNCNLRAANSGPAVISPCEARSEVSYKRPTWTLALDWKPTRDLLLYVTTRRGYRAGGYDLNVNTPASRTAFAPEVVTDYEGGLKYDFALGPTRGRINFAIYHDDYRDMQRTVPTIFVENGNTIIVQRTGNAATSSIDGYELEAYFRPVPSLEFSLAVSQVKAGFKRFITATGIDLSPNAFSSIPSHTVGAGVEWTVPLDRSLGEIALRGDYYFQGESYTQDSNTDLTTGKKLLQQTLPAYRTYNARVEWRNIAGRRVDLAAYVRNLTKARYYVTGTDFSAALGTAALTPGTPRTFGIEINYNF
jgi:iron complex outermembrane receptor protein